MSKDAPASPASPQLIVPPGTNMPFGMEYPFPVIHPPMGQFIPMGMLPIDSNTVQHYMELATKGGFHPAMFAAPMFTPPNMILNHCGDKLLNDTGNSSSKAANQIQPYMEQVSGTLVSRTTSLSSNIPSIGNDKAPFMPMSPMFFLPFSPGGGAGYFPNYPTFNVITPSTENTKISQEDAKPQQNLTDEQDVVLSSRSEEEKCSDELDVARILVAMQVPVLKQVQSSVVSECNQDSNEAMSSSNQIASSQDIARSSSAPIDVNPMTSHGGLDGPASLVDMPMPFQHSSEQIQNDEQQEETSPNDFVINEVDEQTSEDFKLKDSSDQNDQVRPEELQSENKTLEETTEVKLEVIGEGESAQQHVQSLDITSPEQPPMHVSNNLEIVEVPYDSSEERPGSSGQDLLELKSVKSEVMDISSEQNSVTDSKDVSKESSRSFTSDVLAVSGEQIVTDSEGKNAFKQESPEEIKEKDDLEKDVNHEATCEPGADENGVLKSVYKCDVCSQLFRSPLGLQKHIEFHMDDGKHYTCSICFMHFCNDNALQEHHEKHMRKRPHKCDFCPKAFRDPGSLQKHVRVHTGEKPYKCKDCPRSFAEYSSLRKHQRVHTGEQPYKCQYCSKAFSISGNLQRHILIHTGERPYKCNFCTKAFNNPSHLRRHVKNLHFKGDAAIDEAMLSHYGNPGGTTKAAEHESSPEIKGEETLKQESQHVNCIGTAHLVSADSLESVARNVVIQAL